jgi:hypothetical protein
MSNIGVLFGFSALGMGLGTVGVGRSFIQFGSFGQMLFSRSPPRWMLEGTGILVSGHLIGALYLENPKQRLCYRARLSRLSTYHHCVSHLQFQTIMYGQFLPTVVLGFATCCLLCETGLVSGGFREYEALTKVGFPRRVLEFGGRGT